MATIKVNSSSALTAALKSARDGDVIDLASGNYSLTANKVDKDVTITSSGAAVITKLFVADSSGLTFDNVDFNGADGTKKPFIVRASEDITIRNGDVEGVASGTGKGVGIWAGANSDFTLENMTVHGFETGVFLVNIDGATVKNNKISNIGLDGIIAGQIRDGHIVGNSIDLATPTGTRHSDGIQFWNNPPNSPSRDIVIEDNTITTHNTLSHGIYMQNAVAVGGGGSGSFFQNVTIKDNVLVIGDDYGIAWAHTNHLEITGNIVLMDKAFASERSVPRIHVAAASTDVDISGNVVHKASVASDKIWLDVKQSKADWHISDKLIAVGSSLGQAQALLGGGGSAGAAVVAADASDAAAGDSFVFDAKGGADIVQGVSFDAGDRIVLHEFAAGTFQGEGAGADGTSATIASLDGLRALDAASDAVSVREGTMDKLVIDIEQPGGEHAIKLADLAHAYF